MGTEVDTPSASQSMAVERHPWKMNDSLLSYFTVWNKLGVIKTSLHLQIMK